MASNRARTTAGMRLVRPRVGAGRRHRPARLSICRWFRTAVLVVAAMVATSRTSTRLDADHYLPRGLRLADARADAGVARDRPRAGRSPASGLSPANPAGRRRLPVAGVPTQR